MKKITMVFALTLLSALTFQTQAQNGGDDCANAVAAMPGMFTATTINDVTAGNNNGDSAWFVYTATGDGTINVNSCSGGADTRLFIWNDCADGAAAANSDDAANCPVNVDGTGSNFASRIEDFAVTNGENYYIQWDDRWTLDPFNWTLEFVPPPTCPEVANIVITPTAFDAAISWDAVVEATNGYVVNVFDDGSDPMVDTPVYTENIAAGTLMTTATGLMENTDYDAYVMADCDAAGLSLADANSFSTEIACNQAENFTAVMATITEITYTWDDVTEAINGFTLNVFEAGADPMVDTPVYTEMLAAAVTTATATGLMEVTLYDAYLISDCGDVNGMSNASTQTSGTDFTVDESCGGRFLDSGGPTGNYSSSEDTTTTIMPDIPGQIVTVTFTYVDIETSGGGGGTQDGCWDFLTVYDGPDTDSPVLAMTLCGEESGDGGMPSVPESNLAVGTSFTSSHPSGALTFVFISDNSVQETGWEADITCSDVPCEAPENVTLNNITDTTVDVNWDAAPSATGGYQVGVFLQGDDPNVDDDVYLSNVIPAGTTTNTATGLSEGVSYDLYVASRCDVDGGIFALSDPVTFNTILNTTSFETISFNAVPNPTDGFVTIKTNVTIDSLAVYNLLGQVVLERTPNATEFTLNVSNLQSGTYFIKASANGNTTTHKLIRK